MGPAPPLDAGVVVVARGVDRLAGGVLRAASLAALACAAATVAAWSALDWASWWSALSCWLEGALRSPCKGRLAACAWTLADLLCWVWRSEIRIPPASPAMSTETDSVLDKPTRGRSRI